MESLHSKNSNYTEKCKAKQNVSKGHRYKNIVYHGRLWNYLEINPLSVASFANIFSHSEGCLLVLFLVSFAVQKLLSFIRTRFLNRDLEVSDTAQMNP